MIEQDQQNKTVSSPALSWLLKLRNFLAVCLMIATVYIVVYSYISIKGVIEFTVSSANKTASDIAIVMREKSLKAAREQLIAEAYTKVYQVGKELEKAVTAAATMADVLSGMVEEEVIVDVGRDVVNGMLYTSLRTNKNFFGVYTIWEPDRFDMLDLAYAGSKGHDNTGRFIPYWYHDPSGKAKGTPCEDYDNSKKDQNGIVKGAFYLLPKKDGRIHIIDPRRIVIGGIEKLIVSVVAPIMVKNKFVGITGIDLDLGFLQKITDEATSSLIQKQGKLMIISQGGILVASSGTPKDAGTPLQTILNNYRLSKKDHADNDVITYTPIVIERIITPWSIRIAIPEKILRSDTDTIYQKMMSDVSSTTETLDKKSMNALWKLAISGVLLAISTISITVLIRTLEKKEKALKRSEKKYRDLIDSTPDLRYRTDMEGKIVFVSSSVKKLSGYTKKEAIGMRMAEELYVNPEERNTLLTALHKNGYVDDFEAQLKKKDGSIWWASTNAHFSIREDGKILGVEGVTRDITDRKKMENSLQQSQKMESIGTLAGGIAHDFNNILSPIVGHTEMLMEDVPKDSPFREGLNEIFISAIRARDLVKQILTFSRQENSELKLMKIQPIIKEALKLIRSIIPTTIQIKQDIQTDCGMIKADPIQIHQIIMNLTTNAYHAMEETGGELRVDLKEIEFGKLDLIDPDLTPGTYACLVVSDTGKGMDKNVTGKIFDPFFTTKEKGKGTGMGLSVVHGIIKSMDGAIQVQTEPEKGTGFYVYLPVVENSFEDEKIQAKQHLIQGGTEQILLVDDEAAILAIEKRIMKRLGYQVTSYASSVKALEAFRLAPGKYDMVITDMAMPTMSGEKLAVELTKIRPEIPVLLCTGFSETMTEEKAESIGIKGFIMKPIAMKDLAQKIREMLDER